MDQKSRDVERTCMGALIKNQNILERTVGKSIVNTVDKQTEVKKSSR